MSITKFEAQMELSPVQSTEGYPRSEATREYAAPIIVDWMCPDIRHAWPETHNWRGLAEVVNLIQKGC
jgi:hypothetical protein